MLNLHDGTATRIRWKIKFLGELKYYIGMGKPFWYAAINLMHLKKFYAKFQSNYFKNADAEKNHRYGAIHKLL